MKRKASMALIAMLMVLALLLSACGQAAPAPAEPTEEPAAEPAPTEGPALPEGAVLVSTVDELLAAIAPHATIVLQEGEYDLSDAADYGLEDLKGFYRWELVYGGCQLNISNVTGLRLIGQGEVSILAKSRYAEVLHFADCWDLSLEGLTLGHTQEPGVCAAGVLGLESCQDVSLDHCRLYGCGSMGISAANCESVFARSSRIDSCSNGAVTANRCRDVRLEDCQLCDNGMSQNGAGYDLVYAERCRGFALVNCEISGNRMQRLLHNSWSEQLVMLGCKVERNRVSDTVFLLEGRSATVDKCSFERRSYESYYPRSGARFAQSPDGEDLISFDLDHMELARAEYDGPTETPAAAPEKTQLPDGGWEVHVSTVDELLAAIAPHTTIVLAEGEYDLSQAENYGGIGSDWYAWDAVFDGYTLMLNGVVGLKIVGAGRDQTRIITEPRYAAVLSFRGCEQLSLSGFTAGHSPASGACSGNVLDFDDCYAVSIEDCGLFGCGVEGIYATDTSGFAVSGSEIYECSYAAATFNGCQDVSFEGCSVRDCGDEQKNRIYIYGGELSWDGEIFGAGILTIEPDGSRGWESLAW